MFGEACNEFVQVGLESRERVLCIDAEIFVDLSVLGAHVSQDAVPVGLQLRYLRLEVGVGNGGCLFGDNGVTSCFLAIGFIRLALSETGVRWRDGASVEDEISQGS